MSVSNESKTPVSAPKQAGSPDRRELPVPPVFRVVPVSPTSPGSLVFPVSNGHGREKALKALAAHNACTEPNSAGKRLWKFMRDLKAVEKGIGRELEIAELMPAFSEWHRLAQPFLDPAKTRDDYLAEFLAGLRKVRVPTGEGDTIEKARGAVSTLPPSALPIIPGMQDAAESWRRLAALHRELSRRSGDNTYFLSCRDAAKAVSGMNHQTAYNINLTLVRFGVIEIVRVGAQRPKGKASEFRYLLSQTENGAEDDEGFDL
jgi:hypothetical protein